MPVKQFESSLCLNVYVDIDEGKNKFFFSKKKWINKAVVYETKIFCNCSIDDNFTRYTCQFCVRFQGNKSILHNAQA